MMRCSSTGFSPGLRGLFLGLAAALFGAIPPASAEDLKAILQDGTALAGQLRGSLPQDWKFHSDGKSSPLTHIKRIEGPRSSPALQNNQPARVFHLRGGGRITGELIRFTDEQITLDLRGNLMTLPRRAVLAIDPLQGERPVLFEDFAGPTISPRWKTTGNMKFARLGDRAAVQVFPNGSLSRDLEKSVPAFRWSAAIFDPLHENKNAVAGIELQFGNDRSLTILLTSSDPFYSVMHSSEFRLTKQSIRRTSGWRRLTVLSDETRFQVLIDSQLLASGRPPKVPLKSVRLFSEHAQNAVSDSQHAFWFDNVLLSELVPQMKPLKAISFDKQSQVLLATGDGLYGHIVSIDHHRLQLAGAFGETALPWSQVRRIVFAEEAAPSPLEKTAPFGWQADIIFHRLVDHPYQPPDQLSVALLKADANALTLHHPRLGDNAISWDQVDVIVPRFLGRAIVLSPDARHLGNQLKPEFRSKTPVGTEWRGKFSLEKAWADPVFLRIDVAELEPAGPETPPGSRYLSELRNGLLGTEVFLNEKSLGRLNDHIAKRSPSESPETLRLPVPAKLLRAGQNAWRIEQTPLQKNGNEFDDCELGPVVLELEAAREE